MSALLFRRGSVVGRWPSTWAARLRDLSICRFGQCIKIIKLFLEIICCLIFVVKSNLRFEFDSVQKTVKIFFVNLASLPIPMVFKLESLPIWLLNWLVNLFAKMASSPICLPNSPVYQFVFQSDKLTYLMVKMANIPIWWPNCFANLFAKLASLPFFCLIKGSYQCFGRRCRPSAHRRGRVVSDVGQPVWAVQNPFRIGLTSGTGLDRQGEIHLLVITVVSQKMKEVTD